MPLFGSHMSIAGGLHNALLSAQALGCETVQLFTASPSQWSVTAMPAAEADTQTTEQPSLWAARSLDAEAVRLFRSTLRRTKLRFPTAHDSYLINLASPDETLYRRSIEAFVVEMQRAEALGLRYLVMHPGAHLDDTEEAGLARVAAALDEAHTRCPNYRVKVLLETTAGQGTSLGHRFEHLASILALVGDARRLGVCLDTCHVFAAGYALGTEAEYRQTMAHFDRLIGVRRILVLHVNDSLKPFGSRVDRHAHIGCGEMGVEPFRLLVNDSRFRDRPMILETAKEVIDDRPMDEVNLETLRGLLVATDASTLGT